MGLLMLLICLTVLPDANGCGQLQPGQEKQIDFTITDFKLPAAMVYYEDLTARTKESTISTSKSEVETFVRRLIMQSVEDVLYQQGRSALLPDNVISTILQQLDVRINYEPLKCENVITEPMKQPNNGAVANDKTNCIIIGGTVTSTCSETTAPAMKCEHDMIAMNYMAIEPKYYSISGSLKILKTSNAIMANWSNLMWENVLNRVLRSISSRPNGSHFYGASVNLK